MDFFVTADRKLRKEDIQDHKPTTGILKGLRGFFSSAYAVDNLKARIKSVLSFGQLKVVTASTAKEASDKIIQNLGDKGYVANLTIDFHSGYFGVDRLSSSGKETSRLAAGYAGDVTNCYLGQCWAGGNPAMGKPTDYTQDVSGWLDGATTYGNQSAASSISFVLFSHFSGVVPQSWSTDPDNMSKVGFHSVTTRDPITKAAVTTTTTNFIKISNSGEILEQTKGLIPIVK